MGSGVHRFAGAFTIVALTASCSKPAPPPAEATRPADAQHAGITTPHGDHTPHHGGLVMMGGDLHYEVVVDPGGKHQVWFSDAVREGLPASVAKGVVLVVSRKGAPAETLTLVIDDSGESWLAAGKPLANHDVMVKVTFTAQGQPFEVEIPYVAPVQ